MTIKILDATQSDLLSDAVNSYGTIGHQDPDEHFSLAAILEGLYPSSSFYLHLYRDVTDNADNPGEDDKFPFPEIIIECNHYRNETKTEHILISGLDTWKSFFSGIAEGYRITKLQESLPEISTGFNELFLFFADKRGNTPMFQIAFFPI